MMLVKKAAGSVFFKDTFNDVFKDKWINLKDDSWDLIF